MKFIIFFMYIPFVYSELHTFYTKYAEIKGQTLAGIPEIFSVTTLDEQPIDYYDSEKKKLIPRKDWMKEFTSGDKRTKYTEFREDMQQIYKNNIQDLMQQLHQSDGGVHTYQRMYGCWWDDETKDSNGFEQHGYDGEDFITLDMENSRYNTSVQQAESTVEKWNNDRKPVSLKKYHKEDCVFWLKMLIKAALKTTEHPKVSLLQKTPDHYVLCHVTGFHSRNTTILWRKNGHAIGLNNSSELVMTGDLLPNEDGTFQCTLTLFVSPKNWKKDQYACVVEHKSLTEPIQKILTEDEIKSNRESASFICIIYLVVPVIFIALALFLFRKCWSNLKTRYKKLCAPKSVV